MSTPTLALSAAGLTLALAVSSGPARAAALPIVNPGFEADPVTLGAFNVLPPTGWSAWDPGGALDQGQTAVGVLSPQPGHGFFPAGAPEGVNVALVSLGFGVSPAGLEQTLASPVLAFMQYTLRVRVGNIGSGTSLPGSADGGGIDYDLSGFPGYRVELWGGGTLLAADDNTLDGSLGDGEFGESTVVFATGAAPPALGQPLTIRLINLNDDPPGEAPGIEVDFDDVRLDAVSLLDPPGAVPEPGSAALAVLAIGALRAGRRRRR